MAIDSRYKDIDLTLSVKSNAKVNRFFNLANFLTTFNRKMWRFGDVKM
jgi:hypothetical protein